MTGTPRAYAGIWSSHGGAPPGRRSDDVEPDPLAPRNRRLVLWAALAVAAVTAAVAAPPTMAAPMTVDFAGSGKGTVISNPVGISCSNVPGASQTTCNHDFGFYFGTGTLTATAAEGSGFVGWSGTGGGTCTGPVNPCTTGPLYLGALDVVATFAPAPDPPTIETGAASGIAFPSATVAGAVNPGSSLFAISDCYFEYGPTTAYGQTAACRPGTIGPGTSPVAVSASIGVLEPATTYHYRLVAANGGGIGRGLDRTFVTAAAPSDPCPNADRRVEQGVIALRLPNCGAYELVSPPFTAGQSATGQIGPADGDIVRTKSVGGFAGVENSNDVGLGYRSQRTSAGWQTTATAPSASAVPFVGTHGTLDFTEDLSRTLWFGVLRADEGTERYAPILREQDGTLRRAGVEQNVSIDGASDSLSYIPQATSADLRTIAQSTRTRPVLTDGTRDDRVGTVRSLYLSTARADGALHVRQVAHRDGATMFPACPARLGGTPTTRNAVSRNGRQIIFTVACSDSDSTAAQRVWVKTDDDDPIDVSASQCPATCGLPRTVDFRGATPDGRRIFFSTTQRLLPEDTDSDAVPSADLYEYDFDAVGPKLRLVTGGGAGAAFWTLMRVSDDGDYVYFVARGRALDPLNSRNASPQPDGNNLYAYHRPRGRTTGTTIFVGALGSAYAAGGMTSSSGRFLLFQTAADLTGERLPGDTTRDLFRYDAKHDDLRRVWSLDPAHNGSVRRGSASLLPMTENGLQANARLGARQISDDGSLVGFSTTEPLSRDDHNDRGDGYLWHADTGEITLLTDGSSTQSGNAGVGGAGFQGMTPSGDSMLVGTSAPLLPEHTSGQSALYMIRRDGGFPRQPAPPDPCAGDRCQSPTSSPPGSAGVGGSSTFSGPGNLLLAAPKLSATVRVGKVKTVWDSSARVSVRVSGKGKLQVSGARLARTSKSVGEAGSVRVAVKLSKTGQRTLRRKHRVKVRATLRFVPASGEAVTTRVSVTFTAKVKKRKAKASSRSAREPVVLSSAVQKGR